MLLVGFAPEVLALADRRFAGGRPTVIPGFYEHPLYARFTLRRLDDESVPLVLAEDEPYYAAFPELVERLRRDYAAGGRVPVDGDRSLSVLVRKGLASRPYGPEKWPCPAGGQSAQGSENSARMRGRVARRGRRRGSMIDCIAGYHLNPWTCGIAKFNAILAKHLEVPVVGIRAVELGQPAAPARSRSSCRSSRTLTRPTWTSGASATPGGSSCSCTRSTAPRSSARLIAVGRQDLLRQQRTGHSNCTSFRPDAQELFCPARDPEPAAVRAHGPVDLHVRHGAQDPRAAVPRVCVTCSTPTGQTYSVYVSTALHENTSFDGSFVVTFEELQSIFNGQVYFMGYLSDTAVFNHLLDCTYLAAFFEKGLRANNTTVNAAMEQGCSVITNLDEHSPAGLVHMQNVDRHQPAAPACRASRRRGAIGRAARDVALARYGWDQLVAQLRTTVTT